MKTLSIWKEDTDWYQDDLFIDELKYDELIWERRTILHHDLNRDVTLCIYLLRDEDKYILVSQTQETEWYNRRRAYYTVQEFEI